MTGREHHRSGRPLDADGSVAVASLSDEELTEELTVAGMTPSEDRHVRYDELLTERRRRDDGTDRSSR
jgi:hypothetical protein